MSETSKALIVVVAIAALIFRLAKPIALKFSAESDFVRRRNVWFTLTVVAFLTQNFWEFCVVAVPLLVWAGRKDTNPVAFYLILLQVIPGIDVAIPTGGLGINDLFPFNMYRLLALCVLLPAAWRLRHPEDPSQSRGWDALDFLLLAYGVLQVALFVPPDLRVIYHDSFTSGLRRAFLYLVDIYLLYFVVSRTCSNRKVIADAQASFCLSCAVMAPIAIFETLRHWLLYSTLAVRWGAVGANFYLFRDTSLRAQASTDHPLVLGYLLAIAFGFWLYLAGHTKSVLARIGVPLLLWGGLIAAYSRGPWLGAAVIYLAFAVLSPRSLRKAANALVVAAVTVILVGVSPLGSRIAKVLPLMGGTLGSGSIVYRQELAERSWELVKQSPWFGDQNAYSKLQDLRQGQGIIDLVNTYASVALFYGLVGLSLFLAFITLALFRAYRAANAPNADQDFRSLGMSLVASILGTLVMIATCSFISGYVKLFYVLGGLAASYSRLASCSTPVERYDSHAPMGKRAELP